MRASHLRRHRHRDRYLLMGRSSLWGSDHRSEEEEATATMFEVVVDRCTIALAVVLLVVIFVESLETPFWDNLRQASEAAYWHLKAPAPSVR